MATEVALAALATLPTPILVLSSLKTVLLANSAVGRLLGAEQNDPDFDVTDFLKGQTLSQLGIDMVSDGGVPIWVSWERFLDNLASGLQSTAGDRPSQRTPLQDVQSRETPPVAIPEAAAARGRPQVQRRTEKPQDTVVDVVISYPNDQMPSRSRRPRQNQTHRAVHTTCRMIISIWELQGQRFFTLTFTSSAGHPPNKPLSRSSGTTRHPSSNSARSSRSSQSQTPASSSDTSQITSPVEQPSKVSFPPVAPPAQCSAPSAPTDFQKVLKMKNAMLSAIEIPLIAMWKDESVVLPNLAARKLMAVETDPTSDESYDFMSRFRPWTADFSRELQEEANPVLALCRTQQPFTNWQIGLVNEKTGKRSNFDVSGHPVYDEKSGEFLAGLIAFKDVTEYTEKIAHQTAENEEQFRLICDMMPQMIWTTRADGYHDYYSKRWYDYTGLTPANSLGQGWKLPFHPEDMPEATHRWRHSLVTGDEYITEYRCRRFDGQWRWMLGRALPMRDHKTGKILKWFGTCTDIQEVVDAKFSGQRVRRQLLDVLKHSQMTMWILDRQLNVTFHEGSFVMGDATTDRIVGIPILDVFRERLTPQAINKFRKALYRILSGASDLEICENEVNSRWFRSKMVPLKGKTGPNRVEDENYIAGVIVIGSDVTSLRHKEQENIILLAKETAAKEASKMKSSFLANMSHEIRTPIAGVLGMSELLMDTSLDLQQSEFAQNIQRSANSLLTVINDILDFSKIESGRLDIEEVQFSLNHVLRDVAKMLSFAAQRKGLEFRSAIDLRPSEELILLGDPGRIRQILVNLLTNSIKFTSTGFVRLSANIVGETTDTITIDFCVEDSGIGIEEEVKKKLFTPFSQADSSTARRFGGTGLGLTICKNLVDLMHGTIRLDSKLDTGTKAIFSVPFKKLEYQNGTPITELEVGSMPDRLHADLSCSKDSSKEDTRKHQEILALTRSLGDMSVCGDPAQAMLSISGIETPVPELERDQIHILVVEDNPVNQQIALRFIKALKFSAIAVWNGREALEYLLQATSPDLTLEQSQQYPIPSLILMDVQMPVLDGYHATHILRHHAPFTDIEMIAKIPIVAMTASAIQGDREKCEKAGMDDYMAKPVKRALLEKTILKWISRARQGYRHRKRSESPIGSQQQSFGSGCTDHSSICGNVDAIATEFYARNGTSIRLSSSTDAQLRAPTDDAVDVNTKAATVRSNLSKAILAGEIPGGGTEGDRTMRRVEAEDKAQALRDAKLLSVTDLNRGRSIIAPTIMVDGAFEPRSHSSDQAKPVSGAGGPLTTLALTEENVYLFNNTRDNGFIAAGTPPPETRPEGFVYPLSDIPGPPPEGTLAATDLADPDVHAEVLGLSVEETAKSSPSHAGNNTSPAEAGSDRSQSRRDVGGLDPDNRRRSDWSMSTARPTKGYREQEGE
ncbi:ethylene receptor [Fonsecaea pedrosoi]|nr:ethylene receptor [Fonsecaea pedrosoi]